MPKIYLSPSTQESNLTLSGNSEEYYANLIADAMIPYLEASDIEYGRNSPDMTAETSARQANEGDYDLYLSIHSNASAEPYVGRVRGAEVYYYPNSVEGERAATIFANNYKEIYPNPDFVQTIPSRTLIELNRTRMPAILFETVYHDNQEDLTWLSSNIEEIGRNFAISTADYFDVPFNELRSTAAGYVNISSGNLNIRSAPGTRSPIIGILNNGDVVTILQSENGWYRIQYGDTIGYVSSQYIIPL